MSLRLLGVIYRDSAVEAVVDVAASPSKIFMDKIV